MTTESKEQQEYPSGATQAQATDAPGDTANEVGAPDATTKPEEAAEEAPAATKGAKRSGSLVVLAVAIAALLLIAAGAGGAWYYFEHRFAAMQVARGQEEQQVTAMAEQLQATQARLQAVHARMDTMAADIGELKKLTMPTAQIAAKAADIEQRLNRLDQKLQNMAATQLATSDLLERVKRLETNAVNTATLDQRVQALEASGAAARDALTRGASTVLAVGNLARAVATGEPFAEPLTTLNAIAGNDEKLKAAVAALAPFAKQGVPTFAKLRAEFPAVALAISRTEDAGRSGNWEDRVLNRLSTLVTVRRTGAEAVASGGTDGLLASAEQSLAAGDLAGAVDAVGKISGPGAKAAADWLSAARDRLAVDHALAALQDRATVYLSQIKG